MRIGVIGLGKMGRPIAAKLIAAGHELTVWSRSDAAAEGLTGARRSDEPADAMQGDVVLSLLFDEAAIRDVLLTGDALPGAAESCIHVCLSTVSMAFAVELETFHAEHGIAYVAAPMLGRPEVIVGNGLNFLAGGEGGVLDRIEPIFASLGRFWRLGDRPHQGQAAKLAANFLLSGAIEALAEAAAMLTGHGADAVGFFSVMTETLFGAFAYKTYAPMVAGNAPAVPSGLALVIKDNLSFVAAAEQVDAHIPLARAVGENLRAANAAGMGAADWSTALAAVAAGSTTDRRR